MPGEAGRGGSACRRSTAQREQSLPRLPVSLRNVVRKSWPSSRMSDEGTKGSEHHQATGMIGHVLFGQCRLQTAGPFHSAYFANLIPMTCWQAERISKALLARPECRTQIPIQKIKGSVAFLLSAHVQKRLRMFVLPFARRHRQI